MWWRREESIKVQKKVQDILDTVKPLGIWESVPVTVSNMLLTVPLYPITFIIRKVNWGFRKVSL